MKSERLYLVQTDTTAGFLSGDPLKIARAKKRDPRQPLLLCVDTLAKQKRLVRTPSLHKKRVRRAQKTTFIYADHPHTPAIRVVRDERHARFLSKFDFLYSSSANETGKPFDYETAANEADVILFEPCGFFQGRASSIIKIGKRSLKRVR